MIRSTARMQIPTLHLVEQAVARQAPAAGAHPIGDALFPRLDYASSLDEVEQAIHGAGHALVWLGDMLVTDPEREPHPRDALARAASQLLALQDGLERLLEAEVGKVAARRAIVAHETFRRFLAVCAQAPHASSGDPLDRSGAAKPPLEYMREVAVRLALLVLAIEHLLGHGSAFLAPLADKAFETSQTFRRAAQGIGLDLTPWLDAPPAKRWKRIMEAASGFWGALDDDQRRAVDEAWSERVELPPQ
jgi:hypothetical protein